jgi:hypothetical protein
LLILLMIYVYAFCPVPDSPLSLPEGIAHPEVQLTAVDKIGAVAEPDVDVSHVREDDAQLMNAVLAHDRVLGHLFDQTVLLPLRFGTQFTSRASLETFLVNHQHTYRQRLDALQDRAEYLLKLTPQLPAVSDETLKGREYFLAKKQRLQAQATLREQRDVEYQQFLSYLQESNILFVQSAPQDDEMRLHVLLGRDGAIAGERVSAWQVTLPSWQLSCSQPLPPYHFAT